jgi:predicted  nucleic acid-binding Zn-ribbon protein
VSSENTGEMNSKRPFEERVFARFDALDLAMLVTDSRLENVESRLENVDSRLETVDARLQSMDSRLQKLEIRAYDTKPIWEQALKEIVDTRKEIVDTRRDLSKRLDRFAAIALETRADLQDVEDRVDKLERKPPVQ